MRAKGRLTLELHAEHWNAAIGQRRSRRRFTSRPLDEGLQADLRAFCEGFRSFPEARAVFIDRSPAPVLQGLVGHYGKIAGAIAFVALIGDVGSPTVQEKAGYTGEGVVLEATSRGVGTCWVAGTFQPELAGRMAGASGRERALAVIPLGYPAEGWSLEERFMTAFGRNHRRKPLAELVAGPPAVWPPWAGPALEAARLAPSAFNRQPWLFTVQDDAITLAVQGPEVERGISKRLDCGIAMLHLEIAVLCQGLAGEWEFLAEPRVARYKITAQLVGHA